MQARCLPWTTISKVVCGKVRTSLLSATELLDLPAGLAIHHH